MGSLLAKTMAKQNYFGGYHQEMKYPLAFLLLEAPPKLLLHTADFLFIFIDLIYTTMRFVPVDKHALVWIITLLRVI